MKLEKQSFTVEELDGLFVVVDRQTWDNENPQALKSTTGSTRLAAGPFATKEEADDALQRL